MEQIRIYSDKKISSDGNVLWAADLPICTAIKNQSGPLTVPFDDNYASVIWQDARSSGKADIYNIYAQKIEINEVSIDDPHYENNNLIAHYPNPIKGSVYFTLRNIALNSKSTLDIFNLKGQRVFSYTFDTGQSGFEWNTCEINGTSVPNGVYFYNL